MICFTVTAAGRLDTVLAAKSGESRALVQDWIRRGSVRVNGRVVTKPGVRVRAGDLVEAQALPRPPLAAVPEDIPIDVVYEDEDLLVVAKPAGLPVHPSPGHPRGTLVNALLGRGTSLFASPASVAEAEFRPGIVHRLDKDTSGLLVVAKTEVAYSSLAEQFRRHTILRVYQVLVHGIPEPERGVLTGAIGRHPVHRKQLAVVPPEKGKAAITHYELREAFPATSACSFGGAGRGGRSYEYALLNCRLETGRTHQIRVHLAAFGHPVAGDPVYCPPRLRSVDQEYLGLRAQALHAGTLGFLHPRRREYLEFTQPLPGEFARALSILRQGDEKAGKTKD